MCITLNAHHDEPNVPYCGRGPIRGNLNPYSEDFHVGQYLPEVRSQRKM